MRKFITLLICCFILSGSIVTADTRKMETLDRGLVAMQSGQGIYITWRLLGTEDYNTPFQLYRDGAQIATVSESTNYFDADGTLDSSYMIQAGQEVSGAVTPFTSQKNYFDLPLNRPENITVDGEIYCYTVGDASTGDLDGDGVYEIVLRWDIADSSYVGRTVYLDAYKFDGTQLWRIDLGQNISTSSSCPFTVYDFNGDGIAEVCTKTAPGSTDGTGRFVSEASSNAAIQATDNSVSYARNSFGYVMEGPEYYTVFDGRNGRAMDTVSYPVPRGTDAKNTLSSVWGDNYHHRCDKFNEAAVYLNGSTPSLVLWRGIYFGQKAVGTGRTGICALDLNEENRLVITGRFDTMPGAAGYTFKNEQYTGQGNHNMSVGDMDGDGKDEFVSGGLAMDHDLTPLWCSYRGHGDALHMGDYDPTHPGLEYFSVHESGDTTAYNGTPLDYGMTLYFAEDGTEIFHTGSNRDTGRGMMANMGCGGYYQLSGSSGIGTYSFNGSTFDKLSKENLDAVNFRIFWNGDLYDDFLDSDNPYSILTPVIYSYQQDGLTEIFRADDTTTVNGTKSNPCLQADLFGDWREEFAVPLEDQTALRIFTTDIPTAHRLYTLMHDSMYRSAISWQNASYNQPPHIGYYISETEDGYDQRSEKPDISCTRLSAPEISVTARPVPSAPPVPEPSYTPVPSYFTPVYQEDYENGYTEPAAGTTKWGWASPYHIDNLKMMSSGLFSEIGRYLHFNSSASAGSYRSASMKLPDTLENNAMGFLSFDIQMTNSTTAVNQFALLGSNATLPDRALYSGEDYILLFDQPTDSQNWILNDPAIESTSGSTGEMTKNYWSNRWAHVEAWLDFTKKEVQLNITNRSDGLEMYSGTVKMGAKVEKPESILLNCSRSGTGAIALDNISLYQVGEPPILPTPTALPSPAPSASPAEPVEVKNVSIEQQDALWIISLTLCNYTSNEVKTVLPAFYSGEQLTGVSPAQNLPPEAELPLSISISSGALPEKLKLFFWDSYNSMLPIFPAMTIDLL